MQATRRMGTTRHESLRMMDMSNRTIDAEPATAMGDLSSPGWGNDRLTNGIIGALRTVHDPEIPVNVFDLGLIYRIDVKDPGLVEIDMTLTAPGCPVAGEMLGWVKAAVSSVEGVTETKVNLVFDPPWDQSRMSEEAKLDLGLS
jgi:FeS assembly SUF system protein